MPVTGPLCGTEPALLYSEKCGYILQFYSAVLLSMMYYFICKYSIMGLKIEIALEDVIFL